MKKLKDILKNVDLVEIIGSKEVKIREIKFDSRSVKVNDVFVALNGTTTDGNKYIEDSKETIKWEDGKEYPLVKMEISSDSHPFYTGKTKLVDTAGRIDKFKNKYQKFKK